MNLSDYQILALRTQRPDLTDPQRLVQSALGLTGEAGEFADYVKKIEFHGHAVQSDDLTSELGDVLWYLAAACDALGVDLAEVAKQNIEKLQRRYPEGFEEQRSIWREVNE